MPFILKALTWTEFLVELWALIRAICKSLQTSVTIIFSRIVEMLFTCNANVFLYTIISILTNLTGAYNNIDHFR